MRLLEINRPVHRPCSAFPRAAGRLRAATLLGLILAAPCAGLFAQPMIEANAVLTSQSGPVEVLDAAGNVRHVKPRSALMPEALQWSTGPDGRAYLTFSNGTAVGLGASTQLRFLEYRQQPFTPEKAGFRYEPSTSRLRFSLERGEIAVVCQRVSPVSDIRVDLPYGSLRIQRGIASIRYDQTGLHLAMIEGNLTYDYPGGEEREFVSAGSSVRISAQSAKRGEVADRRPLEELFAETAQLHKAAQNASRRVLFRANAGTGAPPEPALVVRPVAYEQPSPRPYEFRE